MASRMRESSLPLLRSPEDVARHVHISSIYLQQAFHIMTGCTLGGYIRCRKLHEAAQELICTQQKVIDIALKYGYETPESFTKAFSRFHGFPPSQVRKRPSLARSFLPICIHIDIRGGADDIPPSFTPVPMQFRHAKGHRE